MNNKPETIIDKRMIKRALRKSSVSESYIKQRKHINEEKNLKEQRAHAYKGIHFVDPEKNYEWVKANVSSSENESLPIRSPRSNKFGNSFFNVNAELNVMNRGKEGCNESLNLEIPKSSPQPGAIKGTNEPMALSSEDTRSFQGANLLSTSISIPLGQVSDRKFTEIGPSRTPAGLLGNRSIEMRPSDIQFNHLSNDAPRGHTGFHSLKKYVKENNQIDAQSFDSCSNPCEWMSISNTNDMSCHATETNIKNSFKAHYDVNSHNDEEQKRNDDIDPSRRVMKKSKISVYISDCDTEDSEGKSHEVICRVNLENLDDKEDRLSQLDEVNVSAIKIEELNLPGLKLAQIVTEKLPLSLIHDLSQPSGVGKHSYSCPSQFNSRKDDSNKEIEAGRQHLIPSYGKDKLENCHDMCQNSRNTQSSHRNTVTEEIKRHNVPSLFSRNVTNLERSRHVDNSDWDVKDGVSSSNYSAHSDSSLSVFSVHSSDISFSCPCSTSISHCSMREEIPCDSLPYLLLQHLSLGKKVKNESMKSGSNEMYNVRGEKSKAVSCGENGTENMSNSVEMKVNAYDGHVKLDELQKKVVAEMVVAEQVSKALNLCHSSSVFSGSSEQVEGERLLLLSTVRKQAALDELRRLKSQEMSDDGRNECIEVSIQNMKLLLRDDFMDKLAGSKQHDIFYFLCMVQYKDTVLCTEALPAMSGNSTISFPSKSIKIACEWLDELCISFSVYMLQVKFTKLDKAKGKLSKKSIGEFQRSNVLPKQGQRCLFSCGLVSSEKHREKSPNFHEDFQTRVPRFVLIANAELHLPHDIDENYFTLQQYENRSNDGETIQPLYDAAHLTISCEFPTRKLDDTMSGSIIKYQGFLTQFVMIEDIGAWQRGWWCLKGSYLMNWKYPEDQDKSPPRMSVDLKLCVEEISPVSRLKCARSNTFSIKMKAEHQLHSGEPTTSLSLPLCISKAETFTEHILSADTRGERDDWCKKLNGILISLQSWKFNNLTHVNRKDC